MSTLPDTEPIPSTSKAPPAEEVSEVVIYGNGIKAHDLVWAKVKGFPWWPGKTLKPENVPHFLMSQIHSAQSVPVLFFGTRDYSWVNLADIRPFDEHVKDFGEKGPKTKPFRAAFAESLTPEVLDEYLYNVAEAEEELQPWVSKELHTASRSKTILEEKQKRKSGAHESVPAAKKARRESAKSALAPKKKTPAEKLLTLRHRLQKIFLSEPMRTDDFGLVEEIFKQVEQFDVTFDLLKETKIGKVIKRISTMTIANEPANVVSRSNVLLNEWRKLLPSADSIPSEESKDKETSVTEATPQEKEPKENEPTKISNEMPQSEAVVEEQVISGENESEKENEMNAFASEVTQEAVTAVLNSAQEEETKAGTPSESKRKLEEETSQNSSEVPST